MLHFVKSFTIVVGNITENERACNGDSDSTFHSHVITIIKLCMSWQLFYKALFIFVETDLHLWSLSDCKQLSLIGRALHKKFIPLCTFLEFYTHLEANSARLFQKCFLQVFKGFKYLYFFKNFIFDECHHFSILLSSHLKFTVIKNFVI